MTINPNTKQESKTQVKLNKPAYDHFEKWLPQEIVDEMEYRMLDSVRSTAVKQILSNPHIYWGLIVDWMESRGYREFEISGHSRKYKEVKMLVYTGQSPKEYVEKIGERTEALCQLVQAFADKEFQIKEKK